MPDVYSDINAADASTQERLAEVLELRAADPDQRAMLEHYTADLDLAPQARLLEVGCGTGAVTRFLATLPGVEAVVGLDPSEIFVERGRELNDDPKLTFTAGDARDLPFEAGSFDALVFHTALSHVPGPEQALLEARRVLRPDGSLVVFDGDYITTTVATYEHDPLQACAAAFVDELVHDPWLMRRLPGLIRAAGFGEITVRGHVYTTTGSDYMLTLVARGADTLASKGRITEATADALKAEAHARVERGTFFGQIAYLSAIARRS